MSRNEPLGDAGARGVIVNVASLAGYEGQQGQVAPQGKEEQLAEEEEGGELAAGREGAGSSRGPRSLSDASTSTRFSSTPAPSG